MEIADFIEDASSCVISGLNNKIVGVGLTIASKSLQCNDAVWDDPVLFRQKKFGYYTWIEINDPRDDKEKDFGYSIDFRLSLLDDLAPSIKGVSHRQIIDYVQVGISINLYRYLHGEVKHTHWSDEDIRKYCDKLDNTMRFAKIKFR